MSKTRILELEDTLLDQIEKLNDDSLMDNEEDARILIGRSKAISDLANSYVEINRMKLDIVRELNSNGGLYKQYLGIESEVENEETSTALCRKTMPKRNTHKNSTTK